LCDDFEYDSQSCTPFSLTTFLVSFFISFNTSIFVAVSSVASDRIRPRWRQKYVSSGQCWGTIPRFPCQAWARSCSDGILLACSWLHDVQGKFPFVLNSSSILFCGVTDLIWFQLHEQINSMHKNLRQSLSDFESQLSKEITDWSSKIADSIHQASLKNAEAIAEANSKIAESTIHHQASLQNKEAIDKLSGKIDLLLYASNISVSKKSE